MWAPGQWNQTSLDAFPPQNLNAENVDWALLAQQWIRMKEVKEHVVMNVAGPSIGQCHIPVEPVSALAPRALTGFCFNASNTVGGEAPMDVEKEENEGNSDAQSNSNSWDWPQTAHWSPNPVPFSTRPNFPPQGVFSGVTGVPQHSGVPIQGSSIGHSNNMPANLALLRVPLLPLPQTRMGSSDEDSGGAYCSSFHGMPTLDAAKRKNLPAWIREGLEKMEREKQKKEEREKFLKERELKRTSELQPADEWQDPSAVARSRFDDTEEEDDESETEVVANNAPEFQEPTEYVMVMIRQLMTEILLEVTTEEIHSAALETTAQRVRVKSRQVQPSLSSISLTQKLGLDQYGSDSDVDSDGNESSSEQVLEIENEELSKGKAKMKERQGMEHNVGEDTEVNQINRLLLQRENAEGSFQEKHVLNDKISKNPTDGTKVDKDISGKLLHGSGMTSSSSSSSTAVDEKQRDALKCVESIKRKCAVVRRSSQSSSGSCDLKSNSRSRSTLKLSPVEKEKEKEKTSRSSSCTTKINQDGERSQSRYSSNSAKRSHDRSKSSLHPREDDANAKKSPRRKTNSDRSGRNRSGSRDRKSRRRRSISPERKASSKRRSPSRETLRSSKFSSRDRVASRKRRSRTRSRSRSRGS